MAKNIINIIKVASVYIGTIIGAGFASGQEILKFFVVYGENSIYGVLFSSILFAIIGCVILNKVYKYKITNYNDYITPIVGSILGRSFEIIICLFLFSIYCVMLAGSGAIFFEQAGIDRGGGILLMAILCLAVFLYDLKGVIIVNTFLSPLILSGIILIGIHIIISKDINAISTEGISQITDKTLNNWFSSSIVYVSYNTLTILVIMTTMLPLLAKKSVAIIGGLAGGLSLGAVALIMWFVLKLYYSDIIWSEIPFLFVVMRQLEAAKGLYAILLYCAMFTTAVASGFGLLNIVSDRLRTDKKVSAIALSIIAIPLAFIGFSSLLGFLYPLFGYIGLFLTVLIIVDGIREITIRENVKLNMCNSVKNGDLN